MTISLVATMLRAAVGGATLAMERPVARLEGATKALAPATKERATVALVRNFIFDGGNMLWNERRMEDGGVPKNVNTIQVVLGDGMQSTKERCSGIQMKTSEVCAVA